ncbi:MAG TPA: c-type cytochrome domain-containing protein, partial [Armatimonadota bacterium]|nr:c-type cytochrome domain-containing protein [Armatimonadota bacterium]
MRQPGGSWSMAVGVLLAPCLTVAASVLAAAATPAKTAPRAQEPARTAAGQFDAQVAPLLARACIQCHNGSLKQGGLDLTTAKSALAGGGRGPAVVPGKPAASWLWKRVAADQMPPKGALTDAEKGLLKTWIDTGARWGTDPIDPFRYTSERRAGYDWWSLQPLRQPELPRVSRAAWA